MESNNFIISTVSEITQKGVKLGKLQKDYKYLKTYTPKINDRVLCVKISGTILVIGAII